MKKKVTITIDRCHSEYNSKSRCPFWQRSERGFQTATCSHPTPGNEGKMLHSAGDQGIPKDCPLEDAE